MKTVRTIYDVAEFLKAINEHEGARYLPRTLIVLAGEESGVTCLEPWLDVMERVSLNHATAMHQGGRESPGTDLALYFRMLAIEFDKLGAKRVARMLNAAADVGEGR